MKHPKPLSVLSFTQRLAFALLLLSSSAFADELKPFESDGCSSFPDGTLAQRELWLDCCVAHDLAYWQGGTYQERVAADAELESCVAEVGEPTIARIMLAGVRVGGSPLWPSKFRWGYGWSYPKFYGELSEEELVLIKAALDKAKEGE